MQATSAMRRNSVHSSVWAASSGDAVEKERVLKLVWLSDESGTWFIYFYSACLLGTASSALKVEVRREGGPDLRRPTFQKLQVYVLRENRFKKS